MRSLTRAVLLQHSHAHAVLAELLALGRFNLPKDEERAHDLAAAGAQMDCPHSKGMLARCMVNGWGVAKDVSRGLDLARESAAAGSHFGQFVIARCRYCGVAGMNGVSECKAEAARLYGLAADHGYAPAQFNLGAMFYEGDGVKQNKAEAARLYRLAAANGHSGAQFHLGFMHDNGEGVTRDEVEAARLYGLAAAQGHAQARANLGILQLGGGVRYADAQSEHRAHPWQQQAQASPHIQVHAPQVCDPASAPAPAFAIGARVRIEGLKAKPELNGCTAVICGDFDPATGRWTVRLDTDNSLAQLLPQNMKLDAGATAHRSSDLREPDWAAVRTKMNAWKV